MFEKIYPKYTDLAPSAVKVTEKPDCLRVECPKYALVRCIDRLVRSKPLETKKARQQERDKFIAEVLAWSKTPANTAVEKAEPMKASAEDEAVALAMASQAAPAEIPETDSKKKPKS